MSLTASKIKAPLWSLKMLLKSYELILEFLFTLVSTIKELMIKKLCSMQTLIGVLIKASSDEILKCARPSARVNRGWIFIQGLHHRVLMLCERR